MTAGGADDALMVRFAAGDVVAFDELYEHYEAPIYGFCLRFLSDADSAADAFQEIFMRVIDSRDSYQPRERFRSWVFTVARRVCVDRVRERAHARRGGHSCDVCARRSSRRDRPHGGVEGRVAGFPITPTP